MKILFATKNPAKLDEVQTIASLEGHEIVGLDFFGIGDVDIEENGATIEENAVLKWRAYVKLLGNSSIFLVADDSGMTIDALGGAPGVKSRRWRDGVTEMTDSEMIDYCLKQLESVPMDQRTAHFVVAMAYGMSGSEPQVATGQEDGVILEHPDMTSYQPGYPFRALFYMPQFGVMLSEAAKLSIEERHGRLLHREQALNKMFSDIKTL